MRRSAPLLLGCAAAAFVLPTAARGQAFTASPTTIHGSVTYDRSVPGVDTITVNTPSAVINWDFVSPFGNPVVFQPAGTTAIFQNSTNIADFAVLNRIIPPGAPIAMNGNVISQLRNAAGQTIPGGTVIFSSPTGIIVGSTAVFDVGRLMLTSLDPVLNGSGEFLIDNNFIQLTATQPGSPAVITLAGSQIRAPGEGSWVALVGPQVTHGGSVRVNGSAAYVGARLVEITINQGLFDINIIAGSTHPNPIVHTGSTGGPASTGAGDNHLIAMVASPQAEPMTMLLSGSVGFDPAVSASVENGAIVLSAGHDTFGTGINVSPEGPAPASVLITGGTFTSDVTGRARTDFIAGNAGAGSLTFTQDVSIAGLARAHLTADQGFAITVGGNASVSAANLQPVIFGGVFDVTGGEALIRAGSGSSIAIAGSATVDASARGGMNDELIAGSGTGGQARVEADKGSIEVGGSLSVLSNGTGFSSRQAPPRSRGGDGNGGTALASARNGGSLTVGGALQVEANGTGTAGTGETPGTGATGTGGAARIEALGGGAVRIEGATNATASGLGGEMGSGAGNVGGSGQGGSATALASGGSIDLAGPVALAADGSGAIGPEGGTGTGGVALIEAFEGRATLAGAAQLQASGTGGDAAFDPGGRGGDGTGGSVGLLAREGATEGVLTAPSATLASLGTGGAGAPGGGVGPGGSGGTGRGDDVSAIAEAGNGRLQVGALTARSIGTGGAGGAGSAQAGGAGGAGFGGDVLAATVAAGAGAAVGRADFASVALTSAGRGGAGGAGSPEGSGGRGSGGRTTLSSTDAPLTVSGQATLAASGTGGAGSSVGSATGGDVVVRSGPLQSGTTGSLSVGTLEGISTATGNPAGGNVLGRWIVTADRGSIALGAANLTASAGGSPAVPATSEIQLLGGTVDVAGQGSFATEGDIRLTAAGSGRLGGGEIILNGRAGIVLTHAGRAAGAFTVDAARFTALTLGDYVADGGAAVRGRDGVAIGAGRDARLGLTASNALVGVTAGRNAVVAGAVTGGDVRIAAGSDVEVAAGGSIGATNNVLVQAGTDYRAAPGTSVQGGSVDIGAGRDATLAQTSATGQLSVSAGNNAIVAGAATGGEVRIVAGQDVAVAAGASIGNAATSAVSVQAGRDYTAAAGTIVRGGTVDLSAGRNATLAQTNAVASLNVTAGGTARFTSAATGSQITIASAEIDVPAGSSVGGAGTTLVSLQVQPQAGETTLGGTTQGPAYTLTEAEAGRLTGNVLRVSAPAGPLGPAGSSRIVVRNLTLNAVAVQAFEIVTPGVTRVEGALLLANSGAAGRIDITAGTRLEVATPGGGVRIRDAAGAPAGTLAVAAGDIWVTDAATLGLLAGDRNFAGRDQALEANAGADAPRGWIEAGAVTLAPRTSLYVQNSGTPAASAGITVGAGGLTIRPSGNGPASVFAFGRRLNPDGSFTTNIPFFRQVNYSFANSAGYTDDSEFNRCLINNPRCGAPFGGLPGGSSDFVLRSFPIPPQQPTGEAIDEDSFAARPLIEEPVTSGSDSTLWTDPDEDDDDEDEEE